MADIDKFLKEREVAGLLRVLRPLSLRKDGRIYLAQKEYIDFSSNDYLGLSGHPKIIAAAKLALDKFGASSSASRLMTGSYELHQQLEDKVAKFKNKEAGLVFNCGYQANLGIIAALYTKSDCIFCDRLSHASIIDGILLSGARLFRFKHNDAGHLESLLKKERKKFKKALIITETIFSMDGDRAPLKELVALKEKYGCQVMVDEAHATGIFGRNGSGVVEEEALTEKIDLIMGTFSKALGGFGAYLATSRKIVDYLINACRSFIYSTSLPPSIIASNIAGLDLVNAEPQRRYELLKSAQYFRERLKACGLKPKGSSQVIPIIIGENFKALKFSELLRERGYWVLPIRPPTVPKAQARLRFSLNFYHDKKILQKLINDISEIRV